MHAFKYRKELNKLDDQSDKSTFFFIDSRPPPLERLFDRHIGTWSFAAAVENWLWLYLEALECRSRPADRDRAEWLAFYLSYVLYKWQTSGSSDVDLLIFVIRSEHFLVAQNLQDRIKACAASHLKYL